MLKFGAETFLYLFTHFYIFLHIFTPFRNKNTTLTHRTYLRLCRRTGPTVWTTEITCTFLRIRFTYTSRV